MGELNNVEIDGYEPLLLATQEQFDLYWTQCVPLLDRVIEKAMHGELTTDDIYEKAMQGQMYVFVCKKDVGEYPDVKFAIVMELINYPRLAALNVVAIGGSHLNPFFKKFWSKLCGWAYMNGIRAIEALVSPAMARIISKFGFNHTYAHMRLNLNED
jgi:hypothetical protein